MNEDLMDSILLNYDFFAEDFGGMFDQNNQLPD